MMKKLQTKTEDGFTLFELIIATILLGTLAAIAIPAYLSSQHQAREEQVKSDVRSSVASVWDYMLTHNGAIPRDNSQFQQVVVVPLSNQHSTSLPTVLTYVRVGGEYTITGRTLGGVAWTYSSERGDFLAGL